MKQGSFPGKAVLQLGRLVKDVIIKYLKICLFSLPIRESEILDFPATPTQGTSLQDEVVML